MPARHLFGTAHERTEQCGSPISTAKPSDNFEAATMLASRAALDGADTRAACGESALAVDRKKATLGASGDLGAIGEL